MDHIRKPELLAPGGSLKKLKTAFTYGADAVYIGGEEFSLRTAAENFSLADLKEGLEFAHNRGGRVYLTANVILHNGDLDDFKAYINEIKHYGFDGVILSDLGAFEIVRTLAPELNIHISTQANTLNYASVNVWHAMGAKRVILARELTKDELSTIRQKVPKELELEMFVHGAMCISYSGRCLLSNYMTNRDSNKGNCSHPCRWKYHLTEELRPNEHMPVYENERGTFIFNSKDLCLIRHMDELIQMGIDSFKIEGRVKTEYYVAAVTQVYREAIDTYLKDPKAYRFDEYWLKELGKVSHRHYCTGFYQGKKAEDNQVYESSSYIREYDLVGTVDSYDGENKILTIIQRNKFSVGDILEIIEPQKRYEEYTVTEMTDENGNPIRSAPHAQMTVRMPFDKEISVDAILRKRRKNEDE